MVLKPNLVAGVTVLPKALVIDMCIVKTIDICGLDAIANAMKEVRSKNVLVAIINAYPEIDACLKSFGITSDNSILEVKFEEYEDTYRVDLWNLQAIQRREGRTTRSSSKQVLYDESFHEVEMATVSERTRNYTASDVGHYI